MNPLLTDAGPLVAIIRGKDRDHGRCTRYAATHPSPLLSTWPVITEAAWILRHDLRMVRTLLAMVGGGRVAVAQLGPDAATWIAGFYDRFADQKPQLADASLMYLASVRNLDTVFTLDRRDFSIYRTEDGRALAIVPD